jgi:hypothetical protein
MSDYFVMCLEACEVALVVLYLYAHRQYIEAFTLLGYFAV